MPADVTGRKLTIADLRPIERIPAARPFRIGEARPPAAPRPAARPPAPQPSPRAAAPPQPAPAPVPEPVALPATAEPPPGAPRVRSTAYLAKKQRSRDKREAALRPEALAMLTVLAERFPAVFGANCLPLAIGVHLEILAVLGCDRRVLSAAMHRWCSRDAYLAATAEGTHRVALDGTPVAELSAAERARAGERLAAVRAATKRARQRRAEAT